MSYFGSRNFNLDASLGLVPKYCTINKFGHAHDCDNAVKTDVWDGSDGLTGTDLWVPMTAAQKVTLASDDPLDGPAGTGMLTCKIYGLESWDATEEQNEIVTLNGTTGVDSLNDYVIVYRMKGLTWGSGGENAGVITATAKTDATVQAAITGTNNQTLMAIYGVPSTKRLRITHADAIVLEGSPAGVVITGELLVCEDPTVTNLGWLVKHEFSMQDGSPFGRDFDPPKVVNGPALVKVQVTADANNSVVTAGFDGVLYTP